MSRDAAKPVGRVTASGYGVLRAGGAVHWYVLAEGPQSVFVADDGRVLAAPADSHTEAELLRRHPDWLVGCYAESRVRRGAVAVQREGIIADLRERANELGGVAA